MTTILVELEDASNIEKLLVFIKGLKGHKKVQIADEEKDILEAMQRMDKGIYHEVSREGLISLAVPSKADFLADLQTSIDEMQAHVRGDIDLPTFEQMMKELEEEEAVYA